MEKWKIEEMHRKSLNSNQKLGFFQAVTKISRTKEGQTYTLYQTDKATRFTDNQL